MSRQGPLNPTLESFKRKPRINVACSHCRKRKIKCVTSNVFSRTPCARCTKMWPSCTYISVEAQGADVKSPSATGGNSRRIFREYDGSITPNQTISQQRRPPPTDGLSNVEITPFQSTMPFSIPVAPSQPLLSGLNSAFLSKLAVENPQNLSFARAGRPAQISSSPAAKYYCDSSTEYPYTEHLQQNHNFTALLHSNIASSSYDKRWLGDVGTPYESLSLPTSLGWPLLPIEPFDAESWNEMILCALEADAAAAHSPASKPHLLQPLCCFSPPSFLPMSGRSSPASSRSSSSASSRLESVDIASHKMCSHCNTTDTPLWRREPVTYRPLCNACGVYLQQRNKMRPAVLMLIQCDDDNDIPGGPECSHCHTHSTSVWRRSKTGAKLCNACGVYERLHGFDRPLALRKDKVRRRGKHPKRMQS
ncbi:Gata zinc finger domain-containing protein [Mycena venus]|uniref:Gata zinc finger domain-containing protein n=1 Tax=Mycena venus TaxID=2733690 RepID=A0A8H6Y0U9_9AGAR|nr:Gata zinc finger domain-containing protein [Mycena venus]